MITLPPFDLDSPTFDDFRRVLTTHEIEIADDDPEFGFIAFYFGGLFCGFTRNGHHFAHVPLSYHDDTELIDRTSFDAEYGRVRRSILETHGPPAAEGRHVYEHRNPDQFYRYCVWPLQHCRLALLQNESDIQFGLDLCLRYLYRDGPAEELLFSADDV